MKNSNRQKIGFLLALAIPLLILLGLTVKPLSTLTSGEDITLLTVPVDPRDLFFGDYVNLRYEIEEVPAEKISVPLLKELERSSFWGKITVYGTLVQEGNVFVLKELSATKPKNSLYLTGKMNHYALNNVEGDPVYDVDFGLERFFVPENTGKELEELSRQGKLVAHIKVKNGHALLQDIEEAH